MLNEFSPVLRKNMGGGVHADVHNVSTCITFDFFTLNTENDFIFKKKLFTKIYQ